MLCLNNVMKGYDDTKKEIRNPNKCLIQLKKLTMFTKNINTKIKQEIDEKTNICFHYIDCRFRKFKTIYDN